MDGMEIRPATLNDLDALVELRVAFLAEVAGGTPDDPALRDALRRYFQACLPTGEMVALVADYENQIVATSGIVFRRLPPTPGNLTGREGYILNMYTLPDSRGCGIATLLLSQLVDLARQRQCDRVSLHAVPGVRGIYEKAGFTFHDREMRLELAPEGESPPSPGTT